MFISWNVFTPKNTSLFFPVGLAILFWLTAQYSLYHAKKHMFRSTWKRNPTYRPNCARVSTESRVPILLGAQCEGASGWVCLRGLIHAQSSPGCAGSCCCSPASPTGHRESRAPNRDAKAPQQGERSALGAPAETCCVGYKIQSLLPFHRLLLVSTASVGGN